VVGDGVSVRADGWCANSVDNYCTDSVVNAACLLCTPTAGHRRTSGDIQATWGSIMNNLDGNNQMAPVNHKHPGHYNGKGKKPCRSLKL
jgi:hypothetical protein